MARLALILGDSGQGKTRAIKTLNPEETVVINMVGKDLPWIGYMKDYKQGIQSGGNLFNPDFSTLAKSRTAYLQIITVLKYISENRQDIKNIVIDDFQYLMSLEFYRETEAGNREWARFENVGLHAIMTFEAARDLRPDLNVFILSHTEEYEIGGDKKTVMKTTGKMVRTNFTPEGLFTMVLITDPDSDFETGRITNYRFRTQSNVGDVIKSPEEMFPLHIPNDFQLIVDRMKEYYEDGIPLEDSKLFA